MNDGTTLEGKTVLITGASRGIGEALVAEALRRGASRVLEVVSECRLQPPVADEAVSECEEGFVHVVASVVTDEQPLVVVQPGEGALDDPADTTETGAVSALAAGDLRPDSTSAQLAPVLVVVVAAVGGDTLRAAARSADRAAHGRHSVDERHQLGHVVAVAARHRPGERDPGRVYEKVMLGARSGSINRARARRGAPFLACTWLESATARDHSISPAARNSASRTSCNRVHTPARCHSSMRR